MPLSRTAQLPAHHRCACRSYTQRVRMVRTYIGGAPCGVVYIQRRAHAEPATHRVITHQGGRCWKGCIFRSYSANVYPKAKPSLRPYGFSPYPIWVVELIPVRTRLGFGGTHVPSQHSRMTTCDSAGADAVTSPSLRVACGWVQGMASPAAGIAAPQMVRRSHH